VLGIEANFFSGIWTKPWSVEGILRRKYLFFCGICVFMTLLVIPAVLFMHMSPLALLAALLFSCGVFILPFMATCLFSSRMDLFASAFFNYQGGNKQLNVFSFIMFVPMIIYFGAYYLLPTLWAHLVVALLGLLGLLLHRWYIHWIATLWFKRRYAIMERWLSE
jgi:diacylglycerol kinase